MMKTYKSAFLNISLRELWVAIVVAACSMSCTPGIQGTWDGSGHVGVADRFKMEVVFESDTRGMVRYSIKDSAARDVPMCQTQVNNKKVSFVIDPSGQTNCSTLARPLRFQGILGAHVISGEVTSNGAPVGVWRAYRRPKK
jgi:hypothetical protein